MKLKVVSTLGQNSTMTVSDVVFGAEANPALIAQAVRVYLSNQRQGTSKVKTRSEINRTKKKWFKQKGTGNARHGARTSNIFVGGGVAHGPTGEQNWDLKMPFGMKRAALRAALTAQAEHIIISEDLMKLDGKTSSAAKILNKITPDAARILIVLDQESDMVMRSVQNLAHVVVTSVSQLNTYQVAYADTVFFTKSSVQAIEKRLALAPKAEKSEKTEQVAPDSSKEVVKAPAAEKTVVKKAAAKPAAKTEKAAPAAKPAAKTTKKVAVKATKTK